MIKNKIIFLLIVLLISSCAQNNKSISNERKNLFDYIEGVSNEINSNWLIRKSDVYNTIIESPPFALNTNKRICVIKRIILKKDKNNQLLPFYEQFINGRSYSIYALNRESLNCQPNSMRNYFYISDILESNAPNYFMFSIAKRVKDKEWLNSKDIEYFDSVSEICLKQEEDMEIVSIYERELNEYNELYLVNLNCKINNEVHYIQLHVNNNLREKKYEYTSVEVVSLSGSHY